MGEGGKPGITFRATAAVVKDGKVVFLVSPDDVAETVEYLKEGKDYIVHAKPVADDDK